MSSPPDKENFESFGFFPSDDTAGKFEFFVPDGTSLPTYTTLYKDEYLTYLDTGGGAGTSINDYTTLALDTKGAVYDLGMLRLQGDPYTEAFANSLADTQVKEITNAESTGTLQTVTNSGTTGGGGGAESFTGGGGTVLGDPHCKLLFVLCCCSLLLFSCVSFYVPTLTIPF
mmetsp:Transcript_14934/g.36344  ORF Transcript_14934/g.36344 Transcript_14934/m.36344 type:complete len:172 (+) Transcript_14934:1119-1634(+)